MNLQLKLSELLKMHDDSFVSDLGLADSLGDSYLVRHNQIYKKIRTAFKKLNYSYTNHDFCNYAVLPYASLPKILKEKKVPYFDNVTVYRELEAQHPNKFKCAELIKVKSNYTLHESAHCLAQEYTKDLNFQILSLNKESQIALKALMAESFANTVEAYGNRSNASETDRLFYELNSYAQMNKKSHTALEQSVELIGPQAVYKLLYIAYVYSNCLMTEIPFKHYQQILDLLIQNTDIKAKALDSTPLRKLVAYAFDLSMDFRLQTTAFYFQSLGIDANLFKILQFDILQILKSTTLLQSFFQKSEHLFE